MVAAATETAVADMAGTLPGAGDNYLYASETYHSVSVFAPVYLELGGAASLGFPITEMFIERRPDGKAYWVQYFEKAVMEYHPEETSANSYQLAPLGVWRFNEKYPQGAPPPKPLPGPEQYHFSETNHTVSDPFLTYWKEHGQVRRFGYPISESFEEVSEADGKTYTVQYFERAVMEYHPELKPPHQVQLTALGTLRHRALYPNGAPMAASNPIPTPSPSPTPYPTATPMPRAELDLIASNNYEDIIGVVWAIGVLKNIGNAPAMNIQVVVNALDENEHIVATSSDFGTTGVVLAPGDIYPFKVLLDSAASTAKTIEYEWNWEPYNPSSFMAQRVYYDLEIEEHSVQASRIGTTIVGRVKNTGSEIARFVKVTAAVYDASGELVDVGDGYAKFEELAPGQDSPFEIRIRHDADFVRYQLVVTGTR